MSSLSASPKANVPVTLDTNSGVAAFSELHLLRSFPPLASPFTIGVSYLAPTADPLLGFFPSRVFSEHALKPQPAQAAWT